MERCEKTHRALSIQQFAEELQVCSETIRRMLRNGELKAFRIRRCWRIPAEQLDRLCGEQPANEK